MNAKIAIAAQRSLLASGRAAIHIMLAVLEFRKRKHL